MRTKHSNTHQDPPPDYERDMSIDPNALDDEWINQPQLTFKYGKALAEARQGLDDAKEALDLEKSVLDRDIRNDPNKYSLPAKLTEAMISNVIQSDPSLRAKVARYNQARYAVSVLEGAVRAIDHRKTALENLVKLLGQNYFSGPVTPHVLSSPASVEAARRGIGRDRIRAALNPK